MCDLHKSELARSLGLKWCHKFTLLGIDFDQSQMEYDFEKAVGKIKKVAKNLRYRYLVIFGKICVIKTLMLIHIAAILPNLPRQKVKEIEKI